MSRVRNGFHALYEMSGKDKAALLILRPLDIIASIWLAYIVAAQTFGSYQNCDCMSSTWGLHGVRCPCSFVQAHTANAVVV